MSGLAAIKRVREFYLMLLASEAVSRELPNLEDLPPDDPVTSFCACGASDALTVRDILAFLDEVRALDLRQRKITDALSGPPDQPRLDQPLQGPEG
jgi:hypothetical protein